MRVVAELQKKKPKKNIKRNRYGNVSKQAASHNPDLGQDSERYKAIEHLHNDSDVRLG